MVKATFLVFLAFIASFGGEKVKINVTGALQSLVPVKHSVKEFIKELSPIMEEPMNWCTAEPTGDFMIVERNKKYTHMKIKVEIVCNEFMAKEYMKNIVRRYKTLMVEQEGYIQAELKKKYPHLRIMWGRDIRNRENVTVQMRNGYGAENSYENKILFFKIFLNEHFIHPVTAKFKTHGYMLSVMNGDQRPSIIRDSGWYSYKIHNKTLKRANPTFRIERVYKTTLNEKFMTQERIY